MHLLADAVQYAAAAAPAVRLATAITRELLKGEPAMRAELSSGAWIEHVPVQDLKGAHKRILGRVAKGAIDPGAIGEDGELSVRDLVAGMDLGAWASARQDALWAMLISGWSYDLRLPELDKATGGVSGAEAFGEIPLDDYEEIERILAPHAAKLARQPSGKGSTTSASSGSSPASPNGSRTA